MSNWINWRWHNSWGKLFVSVAQLWWCWWRCVSIDSSPTSSAGRHRSRDHASTNKFYGFVDFNWMECSKTNVRYLYINVRYCLFIWVFRWWHESDKRNGFWVMHFSWVTRVENGIRTIFVFFLWWEIVSENYSISVNRCISNSENFTKWKKLNKCLSCLKRCHRILKYLPRNVNDRIAMAGGWFVANQLIYK